MSIIDVAYHIAQGFGEQMAEDSQIGGEVCGSAMTVTRMVAAELANAHTVF